MIQHGEVGNTWLKFIYTKGSHEMPHGSLLSQGNGAHMGERPHSGQFPARSQDTTNLRIQRPEGEHARGQGPSLPSPSLHRKLSLFQRCHQVSKQHQNSISHQHSWVWCCKWPRLCPWWEAGVGSVWPKGVSSGHLSYGSSSFSWYQ